MKAKASVSRDRLLIPAEEGFTLLEVLIAITILALMMLALYHSAATIMIRNIGNTLRDDCIKVANEEIYRLRNVPFSNLSSGSRNVVRTVRNFTQTFTIKTDVSDFAGSSSARLVEVTVSWNYHGVAHNCTLSTVISEEE